jgi:nicotinate-nucleotide adenylyltransferase
LEQDAEPGGERHPAQGPRNHHQLPDGARGLSDAPATRSANASVLGILGGTFDPIHHGHLRAALDVVEALGLREVRFVPLRHAVHRDQPETPGALRLAMVRAAIAGEPRFAADDRELREDRPSYTLHTLESLRAELGDEEPFCLLVGRDAFDGFLTWHHPEAILRLAHLVVMRRPGDDPPVDPALEAFATPHRTTDAAALRAAPGGRILLVPVTQLAISSTDIRRRVGDGTSIRYLLPDAVAEIVRTEGLYAAPRG